MKTMKYYSILKLACILIPGIFALSGCKKDSAVEKAPALPPQSGFVMNFGDFSNPGDTLKSAAVADTYTNWGYAYLNVAAWNVTLAAGLAIPTASFAEAFNHEAVYHPNDHNWTWTYNFSSGFISYEAVLTGAIVGDSTSWEMRITKAGAYSNFLWYYGKSAITQTGGNWTLMESPESPNTIIRINWNKYSDGTSDIKYTNIKPGAAANGSYIYYGTTLASFDRYYKIYNTSLSNLTEIEWSSTLHNGHVKDPHHFNDSSWHCWDISLQDVVCP
ncbi:MAG: hypothetical protein HXX13_17905 [Bacteroidetes bacterium]|nr:hypothetical protein [Bacteroidota bacterium]